jgi:tetratricopeptide (TPR) repeat protein
LHQGLLARPHLDLDLRKLVEVAIADDLLAQQRFEETRHRLEQLERRVRDPELLRRLAAALHHLGRREDAAQRLRERAELAGVRERREAAAYFAELGREALREGRPQTARDLCRRALRLDEGLGAAYEVDGDRELAQGRPDRAVDVWKEGLRHSREGARGFLPRLAEAAFRAGKVETLLADLERERAGRPQDVALWRAVADLRLRRGDLESFFALVESPPTPGAADLTAWAGWMRHLSRLDDQAPLLRLLRSLPDSFGPAGWVCHRCGAPDAEARQVCLHCGALEPLHPLDALPVRLALPAEATP